MNRRSFIAYSSLAAIGTALSSSAVASTIQSFANSVQLPTAKQHVRHGMYDLKAIQNPMLPKWITVFEPHQFLKNGFDASSDDLNLMQFNLEKKAYTLGYDNTKITIATDNHSEELSLKEKEQILELGSDTYNVQVLSNIGELPINSQSEMLLFVLKGHIKANGKQQFKNDFIHFKHQALKLYGQGGNLAVLVTKRD